MLGSDEITTPQGPVKWAEKLSSQLLKLQKSDGTWGTLYTDGKEDDPLVATAFASAALAHCRLVIAGELWTLAQRTATPRTLDNRPAATTIPAVIVGSTNSRGDASANRSTTDRADPSRR